MISKAAALEQMPDWQTQNGPFEEQAMPHAPSLLRAALRLTGSRSEAEDLVQETLLAAWRSFEQFEPGTNCKSWLFRIMLNGLSRIRQQSRRIPTTLYVESFDIAAQTRLDPAADAEIEQLLRQLPEEQRVALLLAAVEGFSCSEIAAMTGSPIGTVMSRLSRARATLRAKLLPKLQTLARKRANGL